MKQIIFYYNIKKLINNSTTVYQIEYCERLINKTNILGAGYLAECALIKKANLLATQYSNE
jgi:hypothetical protein